MIMTALKQLSKDDRGATAIEYGLIVAMIALAAMVALNGFASETNQMFNQVTSAVQGASAS